MTPALVTCTVHPWVSLPCAICAVSPESRLSARAQQLHERDLARRIGIPVPDDDMIFDEKGQPV